MALSLRVRKVDANGDRVFGGDQAAFWRNVPDAVAQVAESRLNLWTNQWYLDRAAGTPYEEDVLGFRTEGLRDDSLKARILGTPGVRTIISYASALDRNTRTFTPTAEMDTIFGATTMSGGAVSVNLPVQQER